MLVVSFQVHEACRFIGKVQEREEIRKTEREDMEISSKEIITRLQEERADFWVKIYEEDVTFQNSDANSK